MSTTTVAIDLRRLARSLYLECQREGPDSFRVWGGAESHTVDLGDATHCDCVDFGVHGGPCKHLLRVMLTHGDETVVEALRLLIPYPRAQRSRTATPA